MQSLITNKKIIEDIKEVIASSRQKVAYEVNNTMLLAYWNVGKIIVENEQNGNIKAEYGKQVMKELSKEGQTLTTPEDILKEPYVFEFLDIKEPKPILEKYLEKKLIKHMEKFLLELGKGFMFVGTQQRITLGNTHYYVDMVFYNKILKCYVLIDLKIGKMKPEYAGQMNMYLNYYDSEINDEYDNKPIGIILCKGKKEIDMEYALGGLSNNIFASTYTYYIPNKEQLISEVEKVLT